MSIIIICYNLLIPIHILEEKVAPLDMIMKWNRRGYNPFHDEHLYHEGAMGGEGLDASIDFWKRHGLKYDMDKNDGDFCVMDTLGGPKCPWIEVEYNESKQLMEVWLKGKEKGNPIGPLGS